MMGPIAQPYCVLPNVTFIHYDVDSCISESILKFGIVFPHHFCNMIL